MTLRWPSGSHCRGGRLFVSTRIFEIERKKLEKKKTYGFLGQSAQRVWEQVVQILFPAVKRVEHSWQVLLTLCIGFFLTKGWPPNFWLGKVMINFSAFFHSRSTSTFVGPIFATAVFPFSFFFKGYLGHFVHLGCSQLVQILLAPNVVSHLWQVLWILIRIGFSILQTSFSPVRVCHSCGSICNWKRSANFLALSALISAREILVGWGWDWDCCCFVVLGVVDLDLVVVAVVVVCFVSTAVGIETGISLDCAGAGVGFDCDCDFDDWSVDLGTLRNSQVSY